MSNLPVNPLTKVLLVLSGACLGLAFTLSPPGGVGRILLGVVGGIFLGLFWDEPRP